MRIYYLSNERIPGYSACSIQQINMCESFARAGVPLKLIRPFYFGCAGKADTILDFYGVEHNFRIKTLPGLLSLSRPDKPGKRGLPAIGGATVLLSSILLAIKILLNRCKDQPVIYSRNINATWIFIQMRRFFKRKPLLILYEVHSLKQQPDFFFRTILQKSDGLVCITHALKQALIKTYQLDAAKIHVSPDGVKSARINEPHFSSGDARLILGIPSYYQKIVVYTGQLLHGKGVEVLIKAAAYLQDDVLVLIVGGRPEQVEHYKALAEWEHLTNISFTGFVPPWRVESYQQAADVLVLPNTNESQISAFTSPLKLFEYMSAEKPIVASDLPVFHEILRHKDNAWLVSPGSALALAEGIKSILSDPLLSQRLANQAYANVQNYSWDHRAKAILFFIEQLKCLYE